LVTHSDVKSLQKCAKNTNRFNGIGSTDFTMRPIKMRSCQSARTVLVAQVQLFALKS